MTDKPKIAAASRLRAVLVLLFGIFLGWVPSSCQEQYGTQVQDAHWMPASATNGAFYHGQTFIFGPPAYYYEYTVSEEAFMAHFADYDYEFQEIAGPTVVPRYLSRLVLKADFNLEDETGAMAYQAAVSAIVTNGLSYHRHVGDRTTAIAYDRNRTRAYVYYTTR